MSDMAAAASGPVSREQMRRIRERRVKLCRNALLMDGTTTCIFAGIIDVGGGNESAVALGKNGFVIICDIAVNKSLVLGKFQKNTTLLHLLCQSRLQLLEFLLKRLQKKEPSLTKNAVIALKDSNFKDVTSFLLTTFIGMANCTDHAKTTPLDRLIQSMDSSMKCLRPWLSVFKQLTPWPGSAFVRSVLEKLCQIQFVPRVCGQECYCEVELFKILWQVNSDVVERFSFRSAAKFGNFHMMNLFLRMCSLNMSPPLVVTHVQPDVGPGDYQEPVIVYLIKSKACRQSMTENELVYVIQTLASFSTIDINAQDCDGLNVVYYSALYKTRKVFRFLLNHRTFQADWVNGCGDTLEQLFAWSDMGANNPAALISLRKASGAVGPSESALASPSILNSSVGDTSFKQDATSPLVGQGIWGSKDMPVETQQFENKIQSNFSRLCADMDPDGACLDMLIERGVFPWNKLDNLRAEKSRREKVRRVLTLVLRSGRNGQAALLDALRYSKQHHLVDILENGSVIGVPMQPESCAEDSTLPRMTRVNMAASNELTLDNNIFHSSPASSIEDISLSSNDKSFGLALENGRPPGPETLVCV